SASGPRCDMATVMARTTRAASPPVEANPQIPHTLYLISGVKKAAVSRTMASETSLRWLLNEYSEALPPMAPGITIVGKGLPSHLIARNMRCRFTGQPRALGFRLSYVPPRAARL